MDFETINLIKAINIFHTKWEKWVKFLIECLKWRVKFAKASLGKHIYGYVYKQAYFRTTVYYVTLNDDKWLGGVKLSFGFFFPFSLKYQCH